MADRETARLEIRRHWRDIIPTMTAPAKQNVNGETSWICPLCAHGTNGDGLTVNPRSKDGNGLICFGCGWSGDIIDLYQKTTGADFNEALENLAGVLGLTIVDRPIPFEKLPVEQPTSAQNAQGNVNTPPAEKTPQEAVERPTIDFTAYYDKCRPLLSDPAAASYLAARGISVETARQQGLGFDPAADPASAPGATGNEYKPHPAPRLIIPCGPSYYVARRIDGNPNFKAPNPKGSTAAIFNEAALYAQEAQEIFVTEGALDALSVIEAGAPAIALNSGNNAEALIKKLEQRKTPATLILCKDNDPAGERAAQTLRHGLRRLNLPFIEADINGGGKDPNDGLRADRSAFIEAVEAARQAASGEKERLREEAQRAELERRQRTGPGMIDSFLSEIRTRRYEPIPTGITDIDNALGGGFMRQNLILLGAAPGAGKTALAQWLFEGMAERGTTCLYLNLEMSREQMLARSISRMAARKGHHIKPVEVLQGYKWDWVQEAIVNEAAEEYRANIAPRLIYNPDEVTPNLDSIMEYAEAEANRAEAAGLPAPLLILDYLQVVTGAQREDKVDLIQRTISSLKKDYAIKHNAVVFAIMAQNREANRTGVSGMESGRDTSNIEYGADLLLGLDYTACLPKREADGKIKKGKAADELTPDEKHFKSLRIHKARFSAPGTQVDLYFSGETMTFTQLAPEGMVDPANK